jgi:hypothetical protein
MIKCDAEGNRFEAPYDAELLSFVCDGMQIRDPFISDCGRFESDPVKDYGFAHLDTGGGCQALVLKLPGGDSLMLTATDGISLPTAKDWMIARYNAEEDMMASCKGAEVKMAHEED